MNTLALELARQDSDAFNPYDDVVEWTAEDKQDAVDRYVDRIMDGETWDEDIEGYKADFLCDVEEIMRDKEDDKEARINTAYYIAITKHARDAVNDDPDKYCGEEE